LKVVVMSIFEEMLLYKSVITTTKSATLHSVIPFLKAVLVCVKGREFGLARKVKDRLWNDTTQNEQVYTIVSCSSSGDISNQHCDFTFLVSSGIQLSE